MRQMKIISLLITCAATFAAVADVSAVCNGGFEDGLAGWNGGASMALDDAVAHDGRRSVCLTVADPKTDSVYVTQMVPVKGARIYKASCFVKTENVREAEGHKESVGSGLIVEWADADKKWLTSGKYACGVWGTSDWQKKECAWLNAPDKACYAIVYLALRASGKAWFDDVSLSEILIPTEKVSPADGSSISNNCPRFAWRRLPGVRRYTLELSRDPSFPPEKTHAFDAGGLAEFQLEEPLNPGACYWRVNSPRRTDIETWSFTQTAPSNADCLPPLVQTKACRVTGSHEAFTVKVKDRPWTAKLAFLGVEGRLVGKDNEGLCHYSFSAPSGGWPSGLTEGEIVAVDAAGNRAATMFWLLNAPRPENGVAVGADGAYWQGGRRIFPLGIYEVAPKYMEEVREAGWDVVHAYQWEFSQDDAACRKYLDDCWAANGLRAFIGFDRGVRSRNGIVQGNLAHVARRVGALADHPGLFCWYLYDEPETEGYFVTPDSLTEFADLVRALDPYHPVVMTTWGITMNEYRRTWDTHWTQAYGNPAEVVREVESHRSLLNNASPITLIVCCNDGKQGAAIEKGIAPDPDKFARDYDLMRACAFLGIVKECNGVWWWWFARDNGGKYYSASRSPKAWADLVQVIKELRSIRPLVTADGAVVTGTAAEGKDRVEWWRKTVDGKAIFIAVNTADHPVSVTVAVPGDALRKLTLRRYEVLILKD